MFRKLLILFIVLPFVELFLLVKIAQATSFLFTVALVVVTGLVGAMTARVQGWLVWQKIRIELSHGVLPADGLIEGILLLAAGLLLITPGLITDAVGLALLIPAVRRAVRDWIKRKLREMIEQGRTEIYFFHGGPF